MSNSRYFELELPISPLAEAEVIRRADLNADVNILDIIAISNFIATGEAASVDVGVV